LSRVEPRAEEGFRDEFQIVSGFLRQIGEIFIDDAAHAMKCAINALDFAEFARFKHGADQDWLMTAVGPPPARREL